MSSVIEKLFKHPESYFFRPIKKEVERTRALPEPDLTSDVDKYENPITSAEYDLSLRLSIQRFKQHGQLEVQDIENILSFEKLINSELMQKYQRLIEAIEAKTKVSDEHPQCEFIDIESKEISSQIEAWTNDIAKNINAEKGGLGLNQDEVYELEALSWFHFDSIINTSNTKALEQDINEFYESSDYYKLDLEEQLEKRNELLKNLATKYPLKKDELEILVDLMTAEKDGDSLFRTLHRIWNQYDLGERKGTIAKITSSFLISRIIQNVTPFFFQYGIAYPTIGHVTGNSVSAYFDLMGEVKEAKLMNEVRKKINKRISESLFFRNYEFTQMRSQGEVIKTLDVGKESTISLLTESISVFLPQTVGIGTAFSCLMLINPFLGLINLVSIPLTCLIGKAYDDKIRPIHKSEMKKSEEVATKLASIKKGMQEILTSPHIPEIERSVLDKMDEKDKLSLQKLLNEIKMRYASYFTFNAGVGASAGVGFTFYMMGKISESTILSNVMYAEALNEPFKDLVKMSLRLARHRQNIQRMEEVLGEADKLDLPDGKREEARIPVSNLDNHYISLEGIKFKNILKDVNLDIDKGEFITIVGPSGIGKSTLLRNIAGLFQPDEGSIKIGGINISDIKKYGDESIYSIMSYCNQDPQIFEDMTLRENLMLWSNKQVDDEFLNQILKDLNLQKFVDRLDEKINYFSGGEKVRIGVARTLIKGAKIILLDEPTTSLDSQAASEVRSILKKIHNKYPETTIICVTHDEDLIDDSIELGRSMNLSIPNCTKKQI